MRTFPCNFPKFPVCLWSDCVYQPTNRLMDQLLRLLPLLLLPSAFCVCVLLLFCSCVCVWCPFCVCARFWFCFGGDNPSLITTGPVGVRHMLSLLRNIYMNVVFTSLTRRHTHPYLVIVIAIAIALAIAVPHLTPPPPQYIPFHSLPLLHTHNWCFVSLFNYSIQFDSSIDRSVQ